MTGLPRVLQVAHGHTRFHPGGTEMVALALHRHWRSQGGDCWYLGAAEPQMKAANPGTNMVALSGDQREAVIHTDGFGRLMLEQRDYFGALREFANYLALIKPQVVHFHHLLNFGLEALHVTRNVLPYARIVLTLHDYYLICGNNGQLYRYHANARCLGPELRDCAACLPNATPADLRMRELDVRRTLALVDRLVSPSRFLAERMRAALPGCPEIDIIENTYVGPEPAAVAPRLQGGSFVFGYFGNLSRIKGAGDLLAAAVQLMERGLKPFAIHVNGAQLFPDSAFDGELAAATARLGERVLMRGAYRPDELQERMGAVDCVVFPSLWWENAPLVIYEALSHGKRVIAYPHGGGAEILTRYKTGLLAESSLPGALANAMQAAMDSPAAAAPALRSMAAFAGDYAALYTAGSGQA